jgi:hypothetical protein
MINAMGFVVGNGEMQFLQQSSDIRAITQARQLRDDIHIPRKGRQTLWPDRIDHTHFQTAQACGHGWRSAQKVRPTPIQQAKASRPAAAIWSEIRGVIDPSHGCHPRCNHLLLTVAMMALCH